METIRPNKERAKNAILVIWIIFTLEIISFISGYFQYDLLQKTAIGEVSSQAASANDLRELIISILYLVASFISIVTFIRWFRRAYFNLHLVSTHLKYTEDWAAWSWFVPLLSLFKPYEIMEELYKVTKKLLTEKGIDLNEKFNTKLLSLWWGLWLVSNFIGHMVLRYSWKAETIDELSSSTILGLVANIVGIPLALITIKVIRDYSNVEHLLIELEVDDDESKYLND